MSTILNYLTEQSDDTLRSLFEEIQFWEKEGYLPSEAQIRSIWRLLFGQEPHALQVTIATREVLYAIALRSPLTEGLR